MAGDFLQLRQEPATFPGNRRGLSIFVVRQKNDQATFSLPSAYYYIKTGKVSLNSPSELIRVVEACRDNNRLAQKKLYQHFYGYGMSIAFRYVNNREDAVEILNTAFVKIFKNLDSYDLDKPLKPWLRRILVNTAIDFLRVRKRIEESRDIETVPEPGMSESITSQLAYEEILKLIQELSPSYRTVFNLFVIEGYKHEEIADMLGISIGTSKSNLFKAKAHLKKALEKLETE